MTKAQKPVIWMGSSRKDLCKFPEEVRKVFGMAIYYAQLGGKHPQAVPMKGFKGTGVLEVVEDYNKDTYRCMYTIKYGETVYVLHAFQKKSKKGIATPQTDINVIKSRLAEVRKIEGAKS